MSATVTNPQNDRRTLTHTGGEVGEDNVTLMQNNANDNSPIIEWTCPRKFQRIDYAAGVHPTRFIPRTVEEITDDATVDGATDTFALATNVLPIAGEPNLEDQEWPAVVAYDVTNSQELAIQSINYGANEVTLDNAPAAGTDLKFYPVMGDGVVQYRGLDQFNHEVGSLDQWGTPIQDFSDHDQMKQDSMVYLIGSISFKENERFALYLDAPQQIVWEDPDYPRGNYVSTIEQKVDVSV